jgi:hypothetical protein
MIIDSSVVCPLCGSAACAATLSTHCRHTGKLRGVMMTEAIRELPEQIPFRFSQRHRKKKKVRTK